MFQSLAVLPEQRVLGLSERPGVSSQKLDYQERPLLQPRARPARPSLAAAGRRANAIFSHLWLCRAVRASPPGRSLYPASPCPPPGKAGRVRGTGVRGRTPGGGDRRSAAARLRFPRGCTFVPGLRGPPQSETFLLGPRAAASEARPGIQIRTNFNSGKIIIRRFRDSRK